MSFVLFLVFIEDRPEKLVKNCSLSVSLSLSFESLSVGSHPREQQWTDVQLRLWLVPSPSVHRARASESLKWSERDERVREGKTGGNGLAGNGGNGSVPRPLAGGEWGWEVRKSARNEERNGRLGLTEQAR